MLTVFFLPSPYPSRWQSRGDDTGREVTLHDDQTGKSGHSGVADLQAALGDYEPVPVVCMRPGSARPNDRRCSPPGLVLPSSPYSSLPFRPDSESPRGGKLVVDIEHRVDGGVRGFGSQWGLEVANSRLLGRFVVDDVVKAVLDDLS